MKKAAKWTGSVLLILALSLFLFLMVAPRLGFHVLVVQSGSMSPAFPVGSAVILRQVDPSNISVGDVITYRSPKDPGKTISHRVIKVVPNDGSPMFRTKGDASEEADNYAVPAKYILGRIYFGIPFLGYLWAYLRTPLGFVTMVILPGALIIARETLRIAIHLRGSRRIGIKQSFKHTGSLGLKMNSSIISPQNPDIQG